MSVARVPIPVEVIGIEIPAALRERVQISADNELIANGTLSSDDLAKLRSCAPDSQAWQECIDQLSAQTTLLATGLFPPTLWGSFLSRLQAGDRQTWDEFVRRYRDAIVDCMRAMLGPERRAEADDLVAEFVGWLYLPGRQGNGDVGERLKGLQLLDESGERVHRFRGWLWTTLRRWLSIRARSESRRLRTLRLAAEMAGKMEADASVELRMDQAILCHAADQVLVQIRRDSEVHYLALLDLLRESSLDTTMQWLREKDLPASMASASRVRSKAATLFRQRLTKLFEERFGGTEQEMLQMLDALGRHLADVARREAGPL